MFSTHLLKTAPWYTLAPSLRTLSLLPRLPPDSGIDIQLSPTHHILLAPPDPFPRLPNASTAHTTILYLGAADKAWELQLRLHTAFSHSVSVLPVERVEDIPALLQAMTAAAREVEVNAREERRGAEELLGCLGISEHGMLVLHDVAGSLRGLVSGPGPELLDEADRAMLDEYWEEEWVVG